MLRDEMPDVEVVMTRKTDIFHSVITKAQIANQAKGDLFVCIHVNDAAPIRHREVVGHHTETYYKGKGKKKKKYTRKVTDYNTWTTLVLPKVLKHISMVWARPMPKKKH